MNNLAVIFLEKCLSGLGTQDCRNEQFSPVSRPHFKCDTYGEKNSLTILLHPVGSSRKGRCPAFISCSRAFGISSTARRATSNPPNGPRSPHRNCTGVRSWRNCSAVNSYSGRAPRNIATAATNVNLVKGPEFSLETQQSSRR